MQRRQRRNAVNRERYRGACLLAVVLAASCGRDAPPSSSTTPAAKVTAAVPETALTTITLTAEAQKRLGIETVRAEQRTIARSRTVGGEVVPAGGAQVTVTAPLAGTLGAASQMPAVGSHVEKGQVVLTLVPLAPAERDVRIEAERAVSEAEGRREMAAKRAERSRQLARDGSGSQRAAEEAQAERVAADAALKAARDRLGLAVRNMTASGAILLVAPHTALLRTLHATPGQAVSAGAPLFDLVALETVWLRVPIYAGDIDTIDRRAPAEAVSLGAASGEGGVAATPIAGPPTADAATAGIDLFYSVANRDRKLQPGQRVSVRLPLRTRQESLVVPRAAVLYDALGGTWVYEARDGGVFVRRRVVLSDLIGDTAVLQQGPAAGTPVVTRGAAELFGTEFGVGK
jgi:cobalt-zinc-cadmium efflux system membrane fusion protein